MPRVLNYTPSWLSRPSPGYQVFEPSDKNKQLDLEDPNSYAHINNRRQEYLGPKRTVAHRGTQIFVAVDNEIRWSDLCMLKDEWEDLQQQRSSKKKPQSPSNGNFRVLRVPVSETIRQLSISPNGKFLAVATSHTLKVAVLPDSSHLGQKNTSPLKLKAYTIGPTTHVLSQAPIASVLWHPCGAEGNCIATVTVDAVVRLWEINVENRWSFDSPTTAIDLRKLSAAQSQQDDVSPYRMNENRGFSAYAIDMEVASASFGGTGSATESAWNSMTLWIAMTEGDVYALCPLLPSKWRPSSTQLPFLSQMAVLKSNTLSPDEPISQEDLQQQNDQYEWISNLDSQDPLLLTNEESSYPVEIYSCPRSPGTVPRLQGPFELLAGPEEQDLEVSDIHVIAAKIDTKDLMSDEDDESDPELIFETGLSATIVCLSASSGMVHICLDIDGVEAQWLPRKPLKNRESSLPQQLVVLEALDTLPVTTVAEEEWPCFSSDPASPYSFFLTHHAGVYFFSLDPWLDQLEEELKSPNTAGAEFRLGLFVDGCNTLREKVIDFGTTQPLEMGTSADACIVVQDSDLGYFLLTTSNGQPQAATLDTPTLFDAISLFEDNLDSSDNPFQVIGPARSAYEPPRIFWTPTRLSDYVDKGIPSRYRKKGSEIRLSAATLGVMTGAHRLLSQETHNLGVAIADLFRRCERLLDDLTDQVKRTNEVANRTEQVVGVDRDGYSSGDEDDKENESVTGNDALDNRLQAAKERQERLLARHQELSKKLRRIGGPRLNDLEKEYVREVKKLAGSVLEPEQEDEEEEIHDGKNEGSGETTGLELWQRHREVQRLARELVHRAKEMATEEREQGEGDAQEEEEGGFSIPGDLRRKKVAQVMGLLERESTLVDAAQARLEKLTLGVGG
ncbi:MAG: hypothetical protein Q9167_002633 [Letrouitia subvulpina]